MRCTERPATAMDISQSDVVGQDKDDVRPRGGNGWFRRPWARDVAATRIDVSKTIAVRRMAASFRMVIWMETPRPTFW